MFLLRQTRTVWVGMSGGGSRAAKSWWVEGGASKRVESRWLRVEGRRQPPTWRRKIRGPKSEARMAAG